MVEPCSEGGLTWGARGWRYPWVSCDVNSWELTGIQSVSAIYSAKTPLGWKLYHQVPIGYVYVLKISQASTTGSVALFCRIMIPFLIIGMDRLLNFNPFAPATNHTKDCYIFQPLCHISPYCILSLLNDKHGYVLHCGMMIFLRRAVNSMRIAKLRSLHQHHRCGTRGPRSMWVSKSPRYMGVSKNRGKTPQIIHFNRVFHYFHHPFWGTPIFGNTHMVLTFWPTKNGGFSYGFLYGNMMVRHPGIVLGIHQSPESIRNHHRFKDRPRCAQFVVI